MIESKIIADSINKDGNRLTTFVLTFPRIILSEFNTHRMISKCSASSRAIPFEKTLEKVKTDPFVPILFQKPHKGMQGTEFYEGEDDLDCKADWLRARDAAVKAATSFLRPITKQLSNRLLEPFSWHTVIATATDWENFFALRAHDAAEIHMAELAYDMLEKYNAGEPQLLNSAEFHVPFGDRMPEGLSRAEKAKIAIARCARVSYENFDGDSSPQKDFDLYDRLLSMGHMSPFEHVGIASRNNIRSGNFVGFVQFRKLLESENRKDPRVHKKDQTDTEYGKRY